jgi:hypothetical protein
MLTLKDIYVSDVNPFPSPTNYTWAKTEMGSDLLQIPNAQPKTYYIAIFGFSRSIFQIAATHFQSM